MSCKSQSVKNHSVCIVMCVVTICATLADCQPPHLMNNPFTTALGQQEMSSHVADATTFLRHFLHLSINILSLQHIFYVLVPSD